MGAPLRQRKLSFSARPTPFHSTAPVASPTHIMLLLMGRKLFEDLSWPHVEVEFFRAHLSYMSPVKQLIPVGPYSMGTKGLIHTAWHGSLMFTVWLLHRSYFCLSSRMFNFVRTNVVHQLIIHTKQQAKLSAKLYIRKRDRLRLWPMPQM